MGYEASGSRVNTIFCKLCRKFKAELSATRNYSVNFVNGIGGSSLKKDGVRKHSMTEMHRKALGIEYPMPKLGAAFAATPLGE